MESFEIKIEEVVPGIPVVFFKGYFAKSGGEQMQELVEPLLKSGKIGIVIDFSESKVLSSPGIAALLELLLMITDDYKGKMVITGLDVSKTMFLNMTGILPIALTAPTIEEACRLAR